MRSAPAASSGPVPTLEELTAKIPPEIREALDDLFRAKYVAVKKLNPTPRQS